MLAEGLLTQESADRWRGEYLPRVYLKQTALLKDAKQSFDKLFGRKSVKGIRGNSFKGRGIFRQVVGEQDIANHKALGWEVRDPDCWISPGRANGRRFRKSLCGAISLSRSER